MPPGMAPPAALAHDGEPAKAAPIRAMERPPHELRLRPSGVHGSQKLLRPTVRNYTPDDAAIVLRIWHELMDMHAALDDRFALADNADEAFLNYADAARHRTDYNVRVAVVKDQVVGFSVSCVLPNSPVYKIRTVGYVNDLCVTHRFRGQGIGAILVQDATAWLRSQGAGSLEVYVACANDGAQRFWRRAGGRDYLDRMKLELGEADTA